MTDHADGRYVGRRRPLRDPRRRRGGAHPRSRARRARRDRRHVPLAARPRRARGARRHRGPRDDRRAHPRERRRGGARDPAPRASRSAAATPSSTCRSTASTPTSSPTAAPRCVRDADGTVRQSVKQDVYDAARVVDGLAQPLGHLGPRLGPGHARGDPRAARVRRLHARLAQAQHRREHQGRDRGAAADPHGRGGGRRRRGAQGPPDLLGHPLHRQPAPHGAVRHGARLRARPTPASR